MRRTMTSAALGMAASVAIAGSALAFDCTNVSKSDPADGAQVIFNVATGQIVWATPGLETRLENGIVTLDGENFHGIVAFDFNGDGIVDFSTWVGVGPDGTEVPEGAQLNGPACRGLTSIGLYLAACLGL